MPAFFVIAPPGLEDVCERELRWWLPLVAGDEAPQVAATLARVRGGIAFDSPPAIGHELNHVLKTPSRILVRVAEFGCRDFPKLFKKVRGLPWNDWDFPRSPTPEVSASSHGSRLKMKKRIEETCADGYRAWRKSAVGDFDEASEPRPGLFARFDGDVCTLSLDTSGEHLHKRGYRIDTPEAPLRETLAAALLLKLFEAADGRDWSLIDPMAGSGTFLTEAALLGARHGRGYAYESFAAVRAGRLPRSAPPRSAPAALPRFRALFGIDHSPGALAAAAANAARLPAGLAPTYLAGDLLGGIAVPLAADLPQAGALICNPPYGERLKVGGRLDEFYTRMVAVFEERLAPLRVGLLLPAKVEPRRIGWPAAWRRVSETSFSNGGIPVVFHVRERV